MLTKATRSATEAVGARLRNMKISSCLYIIIYCKERIVPRQEAADEGNTASKAVAELPWMLGVLE